MWLTLSNCDNGYFQFDSIMIYLIIESIRFNNEIDIVIEHSIMVDNGQKIRKIRKIIENIHF